jgi:type IV pilus assembly protein PilE
MKPNTQMNLPAIRGFTLVELMVAIAVIGILAAIGIPGYRQYVLRGNAEEAAAGLASGRVAIEQYFLDNRTYVGINAGAPSSCPTSSNTSFTYTCSNLGAATYTLTATGSGPMAGYTYSINQANQRTTTSPWGNGNCWILRKGDSC